MDMKMTAAAYAKSFDIVNNSNDNGYKNRYEEGVRDSEEANNTFSMKSSVSFEEKFVILFQKFLIYATGISVGIIIVNLIYILLFGGAEITEVVSNIFAAIAMVAINERIK